MEARILLAHLGVVLGLFAFCDESKATIRRVPSEYPTIQAAVDASIAGDTVLVAPGIYSDYTIRVVEGFPRTAVVFLKDGVILQSESGPDVTVISLDDIGNPQPNAIFGDNLASGNSIVEGFATTGVGVDTAVLVADSDWVTFRHCVFRDVELGLWGARSDLRVEGSTFRDCNLGQEGGLISVAGDLYVDGCLYERCSIGGIGGNGYADADLNRAEIYNSKFIDNVGTGMGLFDYQGGVWVRGCCFEGSDDVMVNSAGAYLGDSFPKTIENCVFWKCRVTEPGNSGGGLFAGGPAKIRNNTFVDNSGNSPLFGGGSVILTALPGAEFLNNVITDSDGGPAFRLVSGSVLGGCNVFWNNLEGNAYGYTLQPTDREVDPLFCDPQIGDFTVDAKSPCLPPYSLECELIGALGEGCGTISVQSQSWGKIKASYRENSKGGSP